MLNGAIIQHSEQGKDFAVTVEESLKHLAIQCISAIKKWANEILFLRNLLCLGINTGNTGCV